MNKTALITPLWEIAKNSDQMTLTHREVRILGYGLSSVLSDIALNNSETYEQVGLFLTMITKAGLTHQSRSYYAQRCISLLEADYLRNEGEYF